MYHFVEQEIGNIAVYFRFHLIFGWSTMCAMVGQILATMLSKGIRNKLY